MVDARKVFNEMVKRHHTPKDNSIFSRLMSCMCKQGDLDGAVEVLNGMIRLSVPTRPSHYGILIENFCKKGMYERGIKMLDKVLEKGILMSPLSLLEVEMGAPQSLLEMKAMAYNPMIEYLCNSGQTKNAEVFLRQLMKKGVQDPVAFNDLIRRYSKEVIPESAMELLQIMKRRGIALDADAYASLIKSFVKKGEPADAEAALDGMIECGHLPKPIAVQIGNGGSV
ncbi:hypothetical protein MRB53_001006 [Persea americana]|uniref:Uncharacterized protein n=1 Tax=Persea americana TaxID=3435 RepID=A0ACC2MRG8_PERAE|nr:hypothetical protein MRB53_001006 [Persea americana]